MFGRILVPLDGSPGAERAIPAAARIARAFSSSMILLVVIRSPISSGKYSVPEEYSKADIDKELAKATAYLHRIVQSVELDIITTEVPTLVGAVAPMILSATQSLHADLLVLCTHGHTGFKRWRLGSVAEKVIRHAPIPVLVLPERWSEPATAYQQAVHVLVALDGSSLSEAVLEPAASLTAGLARAASQQGTLQLIRVVDIPSGYGKFRRTVDSFYDAQMRAEAKPEYEQYLETVAKRFSEGELAKYKLAVSTVVSTDPDVAEAILQTADQEKADFIALATHGRGGLQSWALGSITERVLHATKVPLFIVRPQNV
ncbi:MAG: universal stress protein [Ktedonobacteraceae bacterium]